MARFLFTSSIQLNLHFRLGLMETLRQQGHEVIAAAAFDGGEVRLQGRGIRCLPLANLERGGLKPWAEAACLGELLRLYRRERPDLVLNYTIKPVIYGSLAAALVGIPSLCTITGGGYALMRPGLLQLLVRRLYRLALRFPQAVFFQNRDDRDFFLQTGLVQAEKVRLVPGSGVNLDYYSPERGGPTGQSARQGAMVFLFIGRLLWDKGLGELAAAAGRVREQFPQVEVWALGRPDPGNPAAIPEEQIRQWEREGRLRWLGWAEDVRPLISQSEVVVLPSYREGIPRSLLEAMAMAKPIITTDSIGCREVIEDGKNGLMVPARNAEALAAAMRKMLALPAEQRREMGLYGRRKVEQEFDERLVIQAYLQEIDQILAQRGRVASF